MMEERQPSMAELLDASVTKEWFSKDAGEKEFAKGARRLLESPGGPVLPEARFQGRAWPFEVRLPMPSKEVLREMESETDNLPREAPPGPIAAAWLEEVRIWAWKLRLAFRGTERRVRGVWRELYAHWVVLLKALPKKRRERVLKLIREGIGLPWGKEKPKSLRDPHTGGCPQNVNLQEATDEVWRTLHEQIVERAVEPWDCKHRQDVDVLPLGMFPIFWTVKVGTSKIRIVIDLRRLNEFMCKQYCTVELPSVRSGRLRHKRGDRRISFDLHSSYYHGDHKKSCRKWLGFSVADEELPGEAVEWLERNCPQCRWNGRWVFVYASLAMGASNSVADFQEIMSAVVDACQASGVGSATGKMVRQWLGVLFIDDIDAATSENDGPSESPVEWPSSFEAGIELALRLLATLMWLGCDINFEKSNLVPRKDGVFLGVGHDTVNMRFFLSKKRCAKLRTRIADLLQRARVGHRVGARDVARIVGSLWSVEVVCHRAVAIQCRGMIAWLAKMLRRTERLKANAFNMRWLLKRAWRGSVVWSDEADQELKFWTTVQWEDLWAPMGYDVLLAGVNDAVKAARTDSWGSGVIFVAADTSNLATGGGQFTPLGGGEFDCVKFAHHMLRPEVREKCSATREIDGIGSTLKAVEPPRGTRVITVTDNKAVYLALDKGTSHPHLRRASRRIFLYCVRRGLVQHPMWLSRNSALIKFCDTGSRIVDGTDFSAAAGLFWGANDRAVALWGRGFTHDRFASALQVQPIDCPWKLPFTSWHNQAFSSGEDAFNSDWRGSVSWVNAPFAVIGKVYALLRQQQAVAAVVIPRGGKQWWAPLLQKTAEGIVGRWDLDGGDPRCRMVGEAAPPVCRKGLAVVFLDFRRHGMGVSLHGMQSAEEIWGAWLGEGRPTQRWRYFDEQGGWEESVPRQPIPCHARY